MRLRLRPVLAAVVLSLLAAAPAGAASVAYIGTDHNAWLSSPDGAQKVPLTQGGTPDAPWNWPAQGKDGKTVVVHRDTFEGGETRPVLYLYGPDGKLQKANVMPVYSGATAPIYPIGLDMDWSSNAVAYGYQYCGFACNSISRGYWLTFSDNQGAYPTNPQGQSGFYSPTFVGTRVIAADDGGRLFVQPDVPEAPFTTSYTGWLEPNPGYHLHRGTVAKTGRMMAVDWSQYDGSQTKIDQGIWIGQHQGTVPSDLTDICRLPAAADARQLTFSPDGTQIAWQDAEGVKVAGAPNLAAATPDCQLSAPATLIAPGGRNPSFGGADVGAILAPVPPPPGPGPSAPDSGTPGGTTGGSTTGGGTAAKLAVTVPSRVSRTALAKGLRLRITVAGAGRVDASAAVPAKVARRLGLRGAKAGAVGAKGFAAATSVVVARGRVTARGAGTVALTLRPTAAARRKLRRMRGVRLTLRVSQGTSRAQRTLTLR